MRDLVVLSLLMSSIGWFVFQYKHEKRSLWLGVSFLFLMGNLLLTLLVIVGEFPESFITKISAIIIAILVIFLLYYPILFIVGLIVLGIEIIKKEGFSLTHLLSLGLGIAYLIYLIFFPMLKDAFHNPIYAFVYSFLSFIFLSTLIIFALYTITNTLNAIPVLKKKYKYIIVLGSGLIDGEEVTPLLAGRVDKGIEIHRKNKGSLLIMSGGQGSDEKIPEGLAMKNYAIKQRVSNEAIVVEDQSTTTNENLFFSSQLISQLNETGHIIVVTNRYHLLRALLLAKENNIRCDGQGSKTKLYFSVNALIREWIAFLVMYKNKYILFLCSGFLVLLIGFYISSF